MKSQLIFTLLAISLFLPLSLYDGKRFRIVLITIVVLLPFYQSFVFFRYISVAILGVILWFGGSGSILVLKKDPINKWMIVFFIAALISPLITFNIFSNTITAIQDLVFFYMFFFSCFAVFRKHLYDKIFINSLSITILTSVFVQTMQALNFTAFYLYDVNKLNDNTGMGYDSDDRILRFWGTFGNSLTFSSFLAISGVFVFVYLRNSQKRVERIFSYILLVISLYGIILTAGRTALASVIISLIAYSIFKNKKKAFLITTIMVIVVLLSGAFIEQFLSGSSISIFSRFVNFDDDKDFRTELWRLSLPVLLNNPLFGTGPGNLTTQIAPLIQRIYVVESATKVYPWGHVENTYLTVLYTFGIVGFSCFAYMIQRSFYYCFQGVRSNNLQIKQISYALLSAWVAMVINMVSNPAFVSDYRMIAFMLLMVAFSIVVGMYSKTYLPKKIRYVSHEINNPAVEVLTVA
ncbi:O-antigen ligase family protein [Fibrella sp. ES10-3-2-2]|nr:hypothetical protein A6C57_20730 [Fibrella sp. ES10-3-2-2]